MNSSPDTLAVKPRTVSIESVRRQLQTGQQVRITLTPFLVRRSRQEFGPNVGSYVKCELGDESGWIEAVWWEGGKLPKLELESLMAAEVWSVSGFASINHYGGKKTPQIKIETARPLVGMSPLDIQGLVRRSARSEEELSSWLTDCIDSIANTPLQRLLMESIGRDSKWHIPFLRTPAALFYHHAYVGGLADHVKEMVSVWSASRSVYPNVDGDLTLAGILLHDVGKLDTISSSSAPQLALTGRYIDHISTGISRLTSDIDRIPGFPTLLRDQLLHIVASHHGEKEYGSPVVPATREAIIVHHLDRMSSLLSHLEEWTRQSGVDSNGWTTEPSPWIKANLAGSTRIPNTFE
ncbi:MAG: HD domain-containing protein [Chloroflexota bacterium]|jgi:3'-5' exoribonuclease